MMYLKDLSLENSKLESMSVFAGSVAKAVKRKRPEFKVTIKQMPKNNRSFLTGILLSSKQSEVPPLIYLENFYERYKMGLALETVIEEILALYDEKLADVVFPHDGSWLSDFVNVKEHILYKLVNYKLNEKYLESVPHIRFHDLAIVFHVLVDQTDDGIASLKIKNELMELWDISREELFQIAHANTERLFPAKIWKMADIIGKFTEESPTGQMDLKTPMYVATNQITVDGAAVILYENLLKACSLRMNGDFFILPSSLHEVILIPASDEMDAEELREIVTEINRTEVDAVDVLSDTVYRYYADKDALLIAAR